MGLRPFAVQADGLHAAEDAHIGCWCDVQEDGGCSAITGIMFSLAP